MTSSNNLSKLPEYFCQSLMFLRQVIKGQGRLLGKGQGEPAGHSTQHIISI